MRGIATRPLILALSFVLSGCYIKSEAPLITGADSVTPIAVGIYNSSNSYDAGKDYKVGVSGHVTYITEVDRDGKSEVSTYQMRSLRAGYFIAMDRSDFKYGLVHVAGRQIEAYTYLNNYCDGLEEIAFKRNVPLGSLAVSDLHDGDCYFTKFDKLASAMGALLDAGKLEVTETYRPKELKAAQLEPQSAGPHGIAPQAETIFSLLTQLGSSGQLDDLIDLVKAGRAQALNGTELPTTTTPQPNQP